MKGSIVKKGKTYYCVYRVAGKQKWKKGGSTKRMAEKKLRQILHDIDIGDYQELQKEIAFSQFVSDWLEYIKARVKESTFSTYENIIKTSLIPYFGDTRLKAITPSTIEGYISQKRNEGLSNKTVNNHLVPLKKMLKIAVIWKYLRENPSQYVEKPRMEKKEVEILGLGEIEALLDAASTKPKYRLLFQVAIESGLRRGELLALKKEDLDFRNYQINVQRNLWHGRITSLKSHYSKRKVDIRPGLMYELKKHIFANPPSEFVFCNRDGGPIDADNMVARQFKPVLEKAGINKQIKYHALRHTNVALRISSNQNIYYISRQLGHSSIKITLGLYGHLLKEANPQEAKKLYLMLEKC